MLSDVGPHSPYWVQVARGHTPSTGSIGVGVLDEETNLTGLGSIIEILMEASSQQIEIMSEIEKFQQ